MKRLRLIRRVTTGHRVNIPKTARDKLGIEYDDYVEIHVRKVDRNESTTGINKNATEPIVNVDYQTLNEEVAEAL